MKLFAKSVLCAVCACSCVIANASIEDTNKDLEGASKGSGNVKMYYSGGLGFASLDSFDHAGVEYDGSGVSLSGGVHLLVNGINDTLDWESGLLISLTSPQDSDNESIERKYKMVGISAYTGLTIRTPKETAVSAGVYADYQSQYDAPEEYPELDIGQGAGFFFEFQKYSKKDNTFYARLSHGVYTFELDGVDDFEEDVSKTELTFGFRGKFE